jgi:uncharacterized delta-60 repeat protein
MAIQPNGCILLVGRAQESYSDRFDQFAMLRLLPNGTLDDHFGLAGRVKTDFGPGHEGASDVVIRSDGSIVLAGYAHAADGAPLFALARYDASGSLDPTFGTGGRMTTDFGPTWTEPGARSLDMQPDGKLIVVGATSTDYTSKFAIGRFNADGSLDATFGNGGKVFTAFGYSGAARCVAVQGDGRILVAGSAIASDDARSGFALARYLADGSLDRAFGQDGLVLTDFGPTGTGASANSLALHGSNIILAGYVRGDDEVIRFAVARYHSTDIRIDRIDSLLGQVEGLAGARVLNQGQTRSLETKLEAALHQIDRQQVLPARQQVVAFANEVQALVAARILTIQQGELLYLGATMLVSMLS